MCAALVGGNMSVVEGRAVGSMGAVGLAVGRLCVCGGAGEWLLAGCV